MTDAVDGQVECVVCSTNIEADNSITTNYDDIVCGECVQTCYRCDMIGSTNDSFNFVDGDLWCEGCVENRAYWCESCEEYNSSGTSYVSDRQESWCEMCLSEAYWCEDCDEWNSDGCDSCADFTSDDGMRIIHDYSYRPDAIFHSTNKEERLFFGIEIEVEAKDSKSESANHAYKLEGLDLAYLKYDGSLSDGFEIVTHPMSHDFFKNEATELWTVLEDLRSKHGMRVKAWDTRTCGLHIHISRTGFNGGSHMHRFLNLVYSNQEFYETLAGRSSEQWAKFSDIMRNDYVRDRDGRPIEDDHGFAQTVTTRTFKHKLGRRGSDRYSAVNTNNQETLEMRIFRGSVNGETIKAQLDLAHASVEYTRTLNANDVINGALSADNFMWYIFQNEELYPQLSARIDKLVVGLARQEESV
jgi:Putative amidoligase enzyme